MPSASERRQALSSSLWAALGYVAKKRTDRALLVEGSETKISVSIDGKVGRAKIGETVSGVLQLGTSSKRASTKAAPVESVVSLCLLALDSDAARSKFIESVIQHKERHGSLPPVPDSMIQTVEAFLKRLRSSSEEVKAGDLRFALDGE